MKLRELLQRLNQIAERGENLDKEVEVRYCTQLATEPADEITGVDVGFDWGHDRILISTRNDLIMRKDAYIHCSYLPEFICPLRRWRMFAWSGVGTHQHRQQ